VTLMWPWAEESEGGREESTAWRPAPFEAEAGEGWGSGVRRHVEEKMGRERGSGFGDVDQNGADAEATGCFDSGERRMPRGRGYDRGGRRGVSG
jgi:hypothetical protein